MEIWLCVQYCWASASYNPNWAQFTLLCEIKNYDIDISLLYKIMHEKILQGQRLQLGATPLEVQATFDKNKCQRQAMVPTTKP